MLPGCMSAWKKPSRKTCVKNISTPARASAGISIPFAAVVQPGEVHLGDRRACYGLALERGEHGLDSSPQPFFYLGDRQVGWKGRHPVLQLGELVRDVERHEVTPRRQHLAELDVDRTEGLERLAQALSARLAGAPRSQPHERIARKPRDEIVQSEATADRENAQQPRQPSQGARSVFPAARWHRAAARPTRPAFRAPGA